VTIDVILTATFSEGMDASTIGTSTFAFENLNAGTVTYSGTSTTATLTFLDTLQYDTTYKGTITTGVKDIAGNAMTSGYGWRFTTVGETTGTATPAPSPTGTITPSVTPTPVSTGYGAISGIVANEITGIAIAGATVETDVGGYGTTTGSNGRFLMSDIPAGEYLLTASAEDYNPASGTITVENAGTSSVSFSLIPSFLIIPTPTPAATITPLPSLSPSPVPSPTPTGKPLEADFTASPVTGKKPLTVQFADASTGNIKSWKWDFGDGEAATKQNPSHTYQKKGNYTVSLKVKGKDGSTDTESKANYITVLKEDEILADFTADTTSGLPPLEVQFTEQCFGEITSYSWDFGDGSTSSEQNPKHTYTASGEYTASLTVKGAGNISDTEIKEGYITVEKKTSEITLEISNAELSFGSSLALSGQITPAFETTVTLAFTHSNGETDTETVASDENGVYTLNEYFPPSGGTWDITASWDGN
ncbi:MAG: PKD domain-containing protein, partial [Dehalococcoidia bacterium]|nr:PKD domain-containing protein [Dehalococcoidia bacterium]